jgi:amino acid permease
MKQENFSKTWGNWLVFFTIIFLLIGIIINLLILIVYISSNSDGQIPTDRKWSAGVLGVAFTIFAGILYISWLVSQKPSSGLLVFSIIFAIFVTYISALLMASLVGVNHLWETPIS